MTERRGVTTYCPEYGTLRTFALLGILAVATTAAARPVAAAVGAGAVEYALYGVVGGLALLAGGYEVRRQRRRNPHEFAARDVLAQFYEQQRPTPLEHLFHLLVAVAGIAVVWRGAAPALSRQEGALFVLERLAAGEPLPAIDPVNAAWGLAVGVGVVLAAVGLDRLLVGAYREYRYRRASR